MFTKLLKHEFRATRNAMVILCLTALGAGILAGCSMGYMIWAEENFKAVSDWAEVLCVLVMMFSILFISLCGLGSLILMIVRFYRSRFTDEGYLTFTLPVNAHQVLLSSILSSGVNMILAFVTVFASFMLMVFTGLSFVKDFLPDMALVFREGWAMICQGMTWETAGYIVLVIFDMLAGLAYSLVIIMLSVTIGALAAKKHKILAAVAAYYGINAVLAILTGVLSTSVLMYAFDALDGISPALPLSIPGVLFVLIAVGGYFLMHSLVSRKLNLP